MKISESSIVSYVTDKASAVLKTVREAACNVKITTSKVATLALGFIAIYAANSIPTAEAGPFAWAACIAICESTAAAAAAAATAGAAAPALLACVAACSPLLALPFPP